MARKQFVEIRFDQTEKVTARNSAVGGVVVGDLVADGLRTLIIKMPVATAPKKPGRKANAQGSATKRGIVTGGTANNQPPIRPSAALAAAAVAPEA